MADTDVHNFVQYNVLSPDLASPSHYEKSPPEALATEVRQEKILQKLLPHTQASAIIGLQEIPLSWAGVFTLFFEENGYKFIPTFYGNAFNGFMGVALAFPSEVYSLQDMNIEVPARRVQRLNSAEAKKEKVAAQAAEKSLKARAKRLFLGLVNMLPFRPIYEPALRFVGAKSGLISAGPTRYRKKPRENVASRWNRAIFARLAPLDGGQQFVVGVYHMPCLFFDLDVMVIHTALVVEAFDAFAGGDIPRVLLGDFNIKPGDPAYDMVIAGSLDSDRLARIQQRVFPDWRPQLLTPLDSAYCKASGKAGAAGEPEYTNHTFSGGNPFTGTLDYIFISSHFDVSSVIETPPLTDETVICPNHDEPSDHILIGATLTVRGSDDVGGGASADPVSKSAL
eukprot:INCI3873.1.p1 GENE.INCI3873.1~~INCI3873.1.p1  ORF type:complete len:396 (+),score=69.92 INCI3873.1:129-1316(+)